MHYYPFNIGDFHLHTSHLTLEEEAVYRRLLDFYYDTETPIPKETQPVIRRLRLGSFEPQLDQILHEFFTLQEDGWHNFRCDDEIAVYRAKADTSRLNGQKGGRPRKHAASKTQQVNSDNPDLTQPKAKQELEPRTRNNNYNQSALTTRDSKISDELTDTSWAPTD